MRFFFFGTLMDPEVRRLVIGRDLVEGQTEAALLARFRRVHVAKRDYPMLVPYSAGRVEGILAHDVGADAVRRLIAFEGAEYRLVSVLVADPRGHLVSAAAFLSDRSVGPNRRAWSLETWQRRHKRAFLRRVKASMDGYGTRAMLGAMRNPNRR
jgi:hypothetical protein